MKRKSHEASSGFRKPCGRNRHLSLQWTPACWAEMLKLDLGEKDWVQIEEQLCSDTIRLTVGHGLDPRKQGSIRVEIHTFPSSEIRLAILHEPATQTLIMGLAEEAWVQQYFAEQASLD